MGSNSDCRTSNQDSHLKLPFVVSCYVWCSLFTDMRKVPGYYQLLRRMGMYFSGIPGNPPSECCVFHIVITVSLATPSVNSKFGKNQGRHFTWRGNKWAQRYFIDVDSMCKASGWYHLIFSDSHPSSPFILSPLSDFHAPLAFKHTVILDFLESWRIW